MQLFKERVLLLVVKLSFNIFINNTNNGHQNYRSPLYTVCVFADCQDFLYYWKHIKIVSELVSTGSLKFGVSLKHFIVFAKPWLQLLRTK